jgi:amidase
MPDFAASWHGHSSRSGVTRNPHDPRRDPGGSSGGTAAAVAAGLGVAGVGTDTGGSVRVPASFCGVVGLRPTPGLVGRAGVLPLIADQDSPGPIARTVSDAAVLLDVIVGWDEADPTTAVGYQRPPCRYAESLTAGGLRGAPLEHLSTRSCPFTHQRSAVRYRPRPPAFSQVSVMPRFKRA